MKTVIVVIPQEPSPSLSTCLRLWEGRLSTVLMAPEPFELPIANARQSEGLILLEGVEMPCDAIDGSQLIEQLQNYDQQRKWVAAAGTSCVLLAQAGLLVGKPATGAPLPGVIEALRRHGAIYQAAPLVRSGWVITADGSDMAQFANVLLDVLHT